MVLEFIECVLLNKHGVLNRIGIENIEPNQGLNIATAEILRFYRYYN